MYNLVEGIVNKLSLNDIFNFASKNSVNLSLDEGQFILRFLKNNWYSLLKNQNIEVIDDNYNAEQNEVEIINKYNADKQAIEDKIKYNYDTFRSDKFYINCVVCK